MRDWEGCRRRWLMCRVLRPIQSKWQPELLTSSCTALTPLNEASSLLSHVIWWKLALSGSSPKFEGRNTSQDHGFLTTIVALSTFLTIVLTNPQVTPFSTNNRNPKFGFSSKDQPHNRNHVRTTPRIFGHPKGLLQRWHAIYKPMHKAYEAFSSNSNPTSTSSYALRKTSVLDTRPSSMRAYMLIPSIADRREFIKISQAVGVGFLVMGAVGYLVKLSKFPRNSPSR
jgi:hypothetical protein